MLRACQEIENLGGTVTPAWQGNVTTYTQFVTDYYVGPNQKCATVSAECARIQLTGAPPSSFDGRSFLLGTNEDIAACSISIPACSIDEKAVSAMRQSGALSSVILVVEEDFLAIRFSEQKTPAIRSKSMEEFFADSFQGYSMVRERLPHVTVYFQAEQK